MENKSNEKIIEKEIVIKFKIKKFNTLYELNDLDEPIMDQASYQIEDMISDVKHYIENQVIGDLMEVLQSSNFPEEIEYIDDLVDMKVEVDGKEVKLFKRIDNK